MNSNPYRTNEKIATNYFLCLIFYLLFVSNQLYFLTKERVVYSITINPHSPSDHIAKKDFNVDKDELLV